MDGTRMANDLALLWLAALPLFGSPGPATLSVAGVGAAFGFRRGAPYLLGIIAGTVSVMLLAGAGVTALLLAEPELLLGLSLLAGAYILHLAWKIATGPVGDLAAARRKAPAFAPGLLLALANPKAFAVMAALYSGHTVETDDPTTAFLVKAAALACAITLASTSWMAFGAAFARALSHPRVGRAANIVFAVLLVASVVLTFIGGLSAAT